MQIWSHFMNLNMETLVSFHHFLFKIISFHLCLQDGFSPSLTLFPQITTHAKTTHIHKMILLYSHSFLQLNLNFFKKKRDLHLLFIRIPSFSYKINSYLTSALIFFGEITTNAGSKGQLVLSSLSCTF